MKYKSNIHPITYNDIGGEIDKKTESNSKYSDKKYPKDFRKLREKKKEMKARIEDVDFTKKMPW